MENIIKSGKYLLAGVLVVIPLAATWIVLDRSNLESWFRAGFQKSLHGETIVYTGDRHSYISFDEDFVSPPVVLVSPKNRDTPGYRITDVSAAGFLLELYQRAPTHVRFDWLAKWDRWDHFGHYNKDAGLAGHLIVRFAGEQLNVRYTGADDYIATEFWIDDGERVSPGFDETALIDAVLEQSFADYRQEHSCTLLQKIKKFLRFRVVNCPPRNIDRMLPDWTGTDSADWALLREDGGIRLVRTTSSPVAPSESEIVDQLAELLESAKLFDLMRHNNQVLDVVDVALAESVVEPPFTIVHFDTHSDLYAYKDPRTFISPEYIGDFMNTLIARGLVREVYWVLPDWTRNEAYREAYWNASVAEFEGAMHALGAYEEGPVTLDIYLDPDSHLAHMPKPPAAGTAEELIRVPFHKVTLEELPDLSGRSNVYVELDADYFSNSGYHTRFYGSNNPSQEELSALISRVARELVDKGARPRMVTICMSPRFASIEDRGYLTRVFHAAARQAALKDYLVGYRHMDTYGAVSDALNVRRSGVEGELLWSLAKLDAGNPGVDERISIDASDREYQLAVTLVRETAGLSAYEAESVMLRLDLFDGRLDGVVDLARAEYFSALERLDWILPAPVFGDLPQTNLN